MPYEPKWGNIVLVGLKITVHHQECVVPLSTVQSVTIVGASTHGLDCAFGIAQSLYTCFS